jgi:hypothetical protein
MPDRVTEKDVTFVLANADSKDLRDGAKDAALVTSLVKVLNATLDFADEGKMNGGAFALALANKTMATSETMKEATDSRALEIGNQVVGQGLKTVSMASAMSKLSSPGSAVAYAGFATMEKVLMAGGMAGFNKCRTAVLQLSATTAMTGIAAPTGVGAVVGAIAIAADLYNVYGACYADGQGGRDLTFL